MTASKQASSGNINLRVSREERDLIDRAAAFVGKNRTEFVLETMRTEAKNVLLDQRLFSLDADQFKEFELLLSASPSDHLQKTLNTKAPWE